jgi:hypothetical protein
VRGRLLLAAGLACAAALSASATQAQEYNVTGLVVGPGGEPVSGAMVVALALPDSVLTKWATTGGDGAFSVGRIAPGDYILQVTLIGHQTVRRDIAITDADVAAGTIGLEVLAVEIDPLVVSVEHVPFINQRDTLSFNALAFEVRPNATVEDLLKRLPGVEVETDGTITAQGEEVQNVLVDGKEFFGEDPTVATRSLPADAVQRVEVYDKESDTAEFTGIPDGEEERTINLELKEDARRGYFGRMSGGVGAQTENTGSIDLPGVIGTPTDSRVPYDGDFSINRFSPTTQLALLANANNVNRTGFSRDNGGGGGGGNGFTESLGLGVNASRDWSADTWLRTSYFFGKTNNLQNRALEEERLLGSQVGSLVQGLTEAEADDVSHALNVNSQLEFSEGHDLRLRGNLDGSSSSNFTNTLQNQTVMGDPLNSAATRNLSDSDNLGADGRLTWRKRLGESGRSLIAEGRLNYGDSDRLTDLTSVVEGSEPDSTFDRNIVQEQATAGTTLSHSVRLSLTEPLGGGNVLEVFGQRNAIDENQGKTVFDLDVGTPVFNPILSSEFDRTYTYLRGGLRFSRNSENTRVVFGLEVQNSDLYGQVLDSELDVDPISNGFTHVLPQADLRLQLKEGRNVRFRYNTSTREPSISQFQPYADNDDPLNVYIGNPDLNPEYRHRLNGEYRLFDQFSFVNLFTYASVNLTNNNISQSRFVDAEGRQVTTPVNSGQAWGTNVGVNFGTPIRPLGARVSLDYRLNYARETAFVNDAENKSRILENRFNATLENRDKSTFEVRVGGGLSFNDVDYSLNQELNQSYINPRLFVDGSYYLGPWTFATALNFQGYDEQVFGPNLNTTIWEASITRLMMSERAEIQLAAYDLLNQNQGVNVTNTSNYNRTERTQTLGRYAMLRFNYRLGSRSQGRGGGRGGDRRR